MNHWTLDPPVLASLLVTGALYAVGAARLRRSAGRGRGVTDRQLLSFAGGWIALVLSLHSPIAAVSEFLFSVHMTQHEILMLVAAPLLVLARPLGVFVWALPAAWRGAIGRWTRRPAAPRARGPGPARARPGCRTCRWAASFRSATTARAAAACSR